MFLCLFFKSLTRCPRAAGEDHRHHEEEQVVGAAEGEEVRQYGDVELGGRICVGAGELHVCVRPHAVRKVVFFT